MTEFDEMNFEEMYKEVFQDIKIGCRVKIMVSEDRRIEWKSGTVMDKHLSNFLGNKWAAYHQPFIDVLLDDGEVIEKYQCYALFYPRIEFL